MKYVLIVLRVFSLTGKLGILLPRFYYSKRKAKRCFSSELAHLGLKPKQVSILTNAYSEMIPLNPRVYVSKANSHS